MIIYFEVPYGYTSPPDGEYSFIPRKGDFIESLQRKWLADVELRVQKVVFNEAITIARVTLVEED